MSLTPSFYIVLDPSVTYYDPYKTKRYERPKSYLGTQTFNPSHELGKYGGQMSVPSLQNNEGVRFGSPLLSDESTYDRNLAGGIRL